MDPAKCLPTGQRERTAISLDQRLPSANFIGGRYITPVRSLSFIHSVDFAFKLEPLGTSRLGLRTAGTCLAVLNDPANALHRDQPKPLLEQHLAVHSAVGTPQQR